jgi:hypothetical protein
MAAVNGHGKSQGELPSKSTLSFAKHFPSGIQLDWFLRSNSLKLNRRTRRERLKADLAVR